ncbi:MAG: PBP1A family penicillin-binding protein [Bacilli bacterium]|nr:PBP1A family penicillin-binding protein [Bacilli bacterium]
MRKLFKLVRFFIVVFFIVFTFIFIYIKTSPKLEINNCNNVILYDSNNKVFSYGSHSKGWVKLDNISSYLINATIYVEDKNFYKHHGFDYLRIVKASIINLKNKSTVQGASTITQQYAKNLFLSFDKTWKRKWDEAWYTLRIEANYSKDEILEGYLNTINYGHGQYGISNASKYYFNKEASNLSLAEASILTGIPKAPSIYSPLINYDLAKERQLIVLNSLVHNGIITEDEANKAYNEELAFNTNDDKDNINSIMYYQDAVMDELETISNIPKSYDDIKGLKIYTNLDIDMQTYLEETVNNSIPDDSSIETSVVMMNPNTGGIISLIGGRDYLKSSFNRATKSMRQVGSTMKPYLYYAALENGFTTSSTFTSEATTFNLDNKKTYSPKNYNDVYANKPISMATAVAYSDNIYAVKTHLFLGSDALINTARRVGITAKLEDIPSLPLGTNEINIIEMASGYSAFANEGYKIKPHLIEKIVDSDGKVLYQNKEVKELVLNPSVTYILNNMLTATYDSSYIDYNYPTAISLAPKLTHKYALKSGTTNTDNWNIGYNKDIVCAVWVGYDDNKELQKIEYKYAQNIWYNSIEYYERDRTDIDSWYSKPKNISVVLVDPITGVPVGEKTDKSKFMYFIKGTEPTGTESVFDEKDNYSTSQ